MLSSDSNSKLAFLKGALEMQRLRLMSVKAILLSNLNE